MLSELDVHHYSAYDFLKNNINRRIKHWTWAEADLCTVYIFYRIMLIPRLI